MRPVPKLCLTKHDDPACVKTSGTVVLCELYPITSYTPEHPQIVSQIIAKYTTKANRHLYVVPGLDIVVADILRRLHKEELQGAYNENGQQYLNKSFNGVENSSYNGTTSENGFTKNSTKEEHAENKVNVENKINAENNINEKAQPRKRGRPRKGTGPPKIVVPRESKIPKRRNTRNSKRSIIELESIEKMISSSGDSFSKIKRFKQNNLFLNSGFTESRLPSTGAIMTGKKSRRPKQYSKTLKEKVINWNGEHVTLGAGPQQ